MGIAFLVRKRVSMAGIGVVLYWQADHYRSEQLTQMLDRIPHRGSARQVLAAGRAGGLGCTWTGSAKGPHAVLADVPGQELVCVADARIDNRAEVAAALFGAGQSAPADADLLLHGYRRWGTGLADRLVGDFAFAIWDGPRQCLYLARDPFGVRPLFYRQDAHGLLAASEVEQLLALGEATLDGRVVLDYLRTDHRRPRETFFRGICRVLPGHWLLATRDTLQEQRYWQPPAERHQAGDAPQQFHRLFAQAVADRLDPDGVVVAQLSGGLDSSSIVCMAAHLTEGAAVVAASAVYPGLDCDETRYIDTVIRRAGVRSERWDATTAPTLDAAGFCAGHPWAGTAPESLEGDLRLAGQLGATAVLSGFGGDELLFERGVFRDLAADGRWLELVHEALLAPRYSSRSAAFFLRDAVRSTMPDQWLRWYRRLRPRRPTAPQPPEWLGPALADVWTQGSPTEDPSPPPGRSHTADLTWRWLTSPNLWWAVELQVLRAARAGLQLRFPFLDRRLAECVLALPYNERLPHGRMKRLLRSSMKELLPRAIVDRQGVTTFAAMVRRNFARNRPCLRNAFAGEHWLCGNFINREAAKKLFQMLDSAPEGFVDCHAIATVLDIAQFELWLRFLCEQKLATSCGELHEVQQSRSLSG
jgi:asparagine synthase (glutamine-hydrolysing)